MTRIADIKDDDPTNAWSPDGTRLAIFGVSAPVHGRQQRRAHRQAGRSGRLRRAGLDRQVRLRRLCSCHASADWRFEVVEAAPLLSMTRPWRAAAFFDCGALGEMRSVACSGLKCRDWPCRRSIWRSGRQTTTQTASQRGTSPPSISRIASRTTTGAGELDRGATSIALAHARVEDALRARCSAAGSASTTSPRRRRSMVPSSLQQVAAEARGDRPGFRRTGGVQRVDEAVGVDVVGAVTLGQQLADGALAAGDIAGESK